MSVYLSRAWDINALILFRIEDPGCKKLKLSISTPPYARLGICVILTRRFAGDRLTQSQCIGDVSDEIAG